MSKGGGASQEILDCTNISLESAVRDRLKDNKFIDISRLTRDDLRKKRDEIKHIPVGPGKGRLIDQYNVGFIVIVDLLLNTERRHVGF